MNGRELLLEENRKSINNPYSSSQLILSKDVKAIQWGKKTVFSTNSIGKTGYPQAKMLS